MSDVLVLLVGSPDVVVVPATRQFGSIGIRRDALVELAYSSGFLRWPSHPATGVPDKSVAWLCGDMITRFTAHELMRGRHTLIMPIISESFDSKESLESWVSPDSLRGAGQEYTLIFDFDHLVWPVNYQNRHWFVIAYAVRQTFLFLTLC